MDGYPRGYVEHNLPLLLLSGLGQNSDDGVDDRYCYFPRERGLVIKSDLPAVTGTLAKDLLNEFLNADGRNDAWNGVSSKSKEGLTGFRIKPVGRVSLTCDEILPSNDQAKRWARNSYCHLAKLSSRMMGISNLLRTVRCLCLHK
jgi:hypothetical protein